MTETPQKCYHIQLHLPEALDGWLHREIQRQGITLDQMIYLALERYAHSEGTTFDMMQTQTWQLCGALRISEPEPEYISGQNEGGGVITNYAEHVDDLLY